MSVPTEKLFLVNKRHGFMSLKWTRRRFLAGLGSLGAVVGSGLWPRRSSAARETIGGLPVIKSEFDLDFQWPVQLQEHAVWRLAMASA